MSELTSEIINQLAREAGMTRAVGPKRNAWHGWEHELEEFANFVATHVRNTERSAWVIEGAWSSTATPDYWVGSSAWTTDHMKALRFSRRDDAQQAANMMLDGVNVRICEHVWGPAVQPSAPHGWCSEDCRLNGCEAARDAHFQSMQPTHGHRPIKCRALPASAVHSIPEANDRSWLCFHCDERFTDREEARQHFGEMRTGVALCQEPRDLQDALRRARDAENRWMDLAAKLGVERTENERLAHMLASWERQFGTTNPRDAWNRLDSMEGRALAAEERLAAPPPPAPATEGKP